MRCSASYSLILKLFYVGASGYMFLSPLQCQAVDVAVGFFWLEKLYASFQNRQKTEVQKGSLTCPVTQQVGN